MRSFGVPDTLPAGDKTWKSYLIAYHAIPDRFLTINDLAALTGDERYLANALKVRP
jgi:hypothetical protein